MKGLTLKFQSLKFRIDVRTLFTEQLCSDDALEPSSETEALIVELPPLSSLTISPAEQHETPSADSTSSSRKVSEDFAVSGQKRTRVQRDRERSKAKRRKKREAENEAGHALTDSEGELFPRGTEDPKKRLGDRHKKTAHSISTTLDILSTGFAEDHVVSTGMKGARRTLEKKDHSLEDIRALGIRILDEFNGSPNSTYQLVDQNSRVLAVITGPPQDKADDKLGSWSEVVARVPNKLEAAAGKASFGAKDQHHRRGDFRVLAHGISFGGGPQSVGQTGNSPRNDEVLKELLAEKDIQRIAGFQNQLFRTYCFASWAYYSSTLNALLAWSAATFVNGFIQNFVNGCFASITINFGPRTVCYPHTDDANLSFGWCVITAFGNFDWRSGGHLVLWDLNIAIPFPPGCTILLPSALLAHSNTTIKPGETRYSLTQYTSSGVFRWVENGMMSDVTYQASLSKKARQTWKAEKGLRWVKGLTLFPVVNGETREF